MPLCPRWPPQAGPSTALFAPHTPRALAPAHQRSPSLVRSTSSYTSTGPTTNTPTTRRKQHRLPASYYRGGTSRAVLFDARHLPANRDQWAAIFRGVMGSPDQTYGRQLDGMGGGISSLSKVCVVGPSSVGPAADVDYTFAAVGVRDDDVDYSANCGNMSAAVGPFAVDRGLVVPTLTTTTTTTTTPSPGSPGTEGRGGNGSGECVVHIHNTNTGKIIRSTFPVVDGEAAASGDFSIDGVAGTAAPVRLDFLNPGGSRTGELLPTGKVVDHWDDGDDADADADADAELGGAALGVTCIDVGNPCVFVEAEQLLLPFGVPAEFTPADIEKDGVLMHRLEKIRRTAGIRMGLADTEDDVPGSVPKIAMVWKPRQFIGHGKGPFQASERGNICVRALSVGQPHKAVPVTVALSLAAAAQLPGSVVHQCLRTSEDQTQPGSAAGDLEISHPTGLLKVNAKYTGEGHLESAAVYRTARRLMEGTIFWK